MTIKTPPLLDPHLSEVGECVAISVQSLLIIQ